MNWTLSYRHPQTITLLFAVTCAGCGGSAVSDPPVDRALALSAHPSASQADAYVVNARTQTVTIYATGGKAHEPPLAIIGGPDTDIISPNGVAVDRDGNIYVANDYYPGSIVVFGAGPTGHVRKPPLAVISGGSSGIESPVGVALDAAGRIYVANNAGYDSSVTVYAPHPRGNVTGAPLATISGSKTNLHYPQGIAVAPSGEIDVVVGYEHGSVAAYARDPHGLENEAPRGMIGGGASGLSGPTAIVVGQDGKIYVANAEASQGNLGSVTVYAANPRGNVSGPPLALIGGVHSGIAFPAGVALDPTGDIYVTNEFPNTVTVYAPNPSGNVTGPPLGTIRGRVTELARPLGIAVH